MSIYQRNFSKLLMDEPPLVVQPSLAVLFGLNEAIILQQVHYWITRSSKTDEEGRTWAYNSIVAWTKQFPFWSASTIKRGIAALEKRGVLLSKCGNRASFDKTKWYTIDYECLALIEQEGDADKAMPNPCEDPTQQTASPLDGEGELNDFDDFLLETAPEAPNGPSVQNDPIDRINLNRSSGQLDPIDEAKLTRPIPETTFQRLRQKKTDDDDDGSSPEDARTSAPVREPTPLTFESIRRLIDRRFPNIVPGEADTIIRDAQSRGYTPEALYRLLNEAMPYYDTITRPYAYMRRIMIQWEDMGRLEEGGDAAW